MNRKKNHNSRTANFATRRMLCINTLENRRNHKCKNSSIFVSRTHSKPVVHKKSIARSDGKEDKEPREENFPFHSYGRSPKDVHFFILQNILSDLFSIVLDNNAPFMVNGKERKKHHKWTLHWYWTWSQYFFCYKSVYGFKEFL